jgi:hypothetical protein
MHVSFCVNGFVSEFSCPKCDNTQHRNWRRTATHCIIVSVDLAVGTYTGSKLSFVFVLVLPWDKKWPRGNLRCVIKMPQFIIATTQTAHTLNVKSWMFANNSHTIIIDFFTSSICGARDSTVVYWIKRVVPIQKLSACCA